MIRTHSLLSASRNCNLDPDDLGAIMIPFQKLPNLKFIDLSHNHALFEGKTDAVRTFRKLITKAQKSEANTPGGLRDVSGSCNCFS